MLIIEDGTVVTNADSYRTLADARTYATNYGLTLDADDTLAMVQMRQAYVWLTNYYEQRLQGSRVGGAQTGMLPRDYMYAHKTDYANAVPTQFADAQVVMAHHINSGADVNQIKTEQDLASFSVDGAYSETYKDGSSANLRPSAPAITDMLKPFMVNNGARSVYRMHVGYI